MRKLRHAVTLVAAVFCSPSALLAQSNWVITEATAIPVASAARTGVVCSSYDSGVCADISRFYQFDRRLLWRFSFAGNISDEWGLRATVVTGAKSLKMTIEPLLIFGIIKAKYLSEATSLSAELYGSVGGKTRHLPCIDAYDREYYCGNLTAWTDFQEKQASRNEWGIKLMYHY